MRTIYYTKHLTDGHETMEIDYNSMLLKHENKTNTKNTIVP